MFEAIGKKDLGTPAQAVQLRQAVLDDTAYFPGDQAINRSGLAGALVQAGDLNQAIDHSLMILPELGTTLTSVRVLQRLQPVRGAASAAAAAEFCERFDAAGRALRAT